MMVINSSPLESSVQMFSFSDITTENVILFKSVQYNIVRLDVFEGYKSDMTLYCKKQ